ncbi:MAG TPA: FAD-binding oxidoreductase [Myxococcaceae bacterium]|nr:FAD-binding oxidoreductase [Myxococcaceae bacterium]
MALLGQPASGDDAILGVRPARVLRPSTLDEAEEVVRQSAGQGLRLAFVGGGTELELGEPPAALDAVLSTRGLARVVEYAPLDQIVIAEAGLTLGALQATLRERGQMLALDPPWADRATLGGIVATNASGPRRVRYGSVRDLIIGVTLVRADGTRARGGGKVVKNVAGFDLPKLMVGSLGSLGLIASVTFRLHPLPEAASTVLFSRAAPDLLRRVVQAMRREQLEPSAVAALALGADFELGVRFEGFEAGVRSQRDRLLGLSGALEARAEPLDDAAAGAFWARHASVREAPATFRAKLATLPTEVPRAASEAWPALREALGAPRAAFYPTLGLGFVAGDSGATDALAGAVTRARAALGPRGGRLVVHAAPPEVRARVPVWGAEPPARALLAQVKAALDPQQRLSPGRVAGGV